MQKGNFILGIDPGNSGGFVYTDGHSIQWWPMPLIIDGKDKSIDFDGVHEIIHDLQVEDPNLYIFLERAVPMAMGSRHAFNYGRGFAAIEIAVQLTQVPVTYIEPNKWTKEMHEGISQDLKPKVRSLLAMKRLFPKLVAAMPKRLKGGLHDGAVDAFLIAAYGLRKREPSKKTPDLIGDFY